VNEGRTSPAQTARVGESSLAVRPARPGGRQGSRDPPSCRDVVTTGISAIGRLSAGFGLSLLLALPTAARANPPAPTREPGPPPPASPLAPKGEAAAMAERPFGRATYRPGGGLTLRSQDDRVAISINMWGQLQFTAKHDQTPVTGMPATARSRSPRPVGSAGPQVWT